MRSTPWEQSARATGNGTNEEREQTLNQLLSEMDGFHAGPRNRVLSRRTNRSDLLDPALMRPGRFDRKIRILRPDTQGRLEILQVHARNKRLSEEVDLMQVARDLPGLSGADLANIMNEAALEAGRRESERISRADMYNGIDRIIQGVRRPSLRDTLRTKWRFAVHEGGKAVAATLLRQVIESAGRTSHLERVERVSIVPRGRDWTRTIFLRGTDEDYTDEHPRSLDGAPACHCGGPCRRAGGAGRGSHQLQQEGHGGVPPAGHRHRDQLRHVGSGHHHVCSRTQPRQQGQRLCGVGVKH
eukprot:jgi/Botrbrau1/4753/Bobra.0137s0025.1